MDCVFCKIIRGEIPAEKIFENEKILVFLDIRPSNPGHFLLIPKKHCENLLDAEDDCLNEITKAIKKITPVVLQQVGASGFNLIVNNGAVAGQAVFHLHWHIIPRFPEDGHKLFADFPIEKELLKDLADKIKQNLL